MKVSRSATTPGNKKRPVMAGPLFVGADKGKSHASTKLIITNLAHDVTDSDVCELFSEFGSVREVAVHYNCWGYSLGTAHVVYLNPEHAVEAARRYNGVAIDGRPMTITIEGSPNGGALLPPPVPVKMRLSFGPQHKINPFRNPMPHINRSVRGRPKEVKRLGIPRGLGTPQGRASVMAWGKPIGRRPTAAELDLELEEYVKQNKKGKASGKENADKSSSTKKRTPKNTPVRSTTGKKTPVRTPKTSKTPGRTPKRGTSIASHTPGKFPKIQLVRTPISTKKTPGRPRSNTPGKTPKSEKKRTPGRPKTANSTKTPTSASKRAGPGRPRKSTENTPNKTISDKNSEVEDALTESETTIVQDISLEPSDTLAELLDVSSETEKETVAAETDKETTPVETDKQTNADDAEMETNTAQTEKETDAVEKEETEMETSPAKTEKETVAVEKKETEMETNATEKETDTVLSEIQSKTPAKTPKKTPAKAPTKTPAKTPTKTPGKTPAKRRATRGLSAQPPAKKTPGKTNQEQIAEEEENDLENIEPLPAVTKSIKKKHSTKRKVPERVI